MGESSNRASVSRGCFKQPDTRVAGVPEEEGREDDSRKSLKK